MGRGGATAAWREGVWSTTASGPGSGEPARGARVPRSSPCSMTPSPPQRRSSRRRGALATQSYCRGGGHGTDGTEKKERESIKHRSRPRPRVAGLASAGRCGASTRVAGGSWVGRERWGVREGIRRPPKRPPRAARARCAGQAGRGAGSDERAPFSAGRWCRLAGGRADGLTGERAGGGGRGSGRARWQRRRSRCRWRGVEGVVGMAEPDRRKWFLPAGMYWRACSGRLAQSRGGRFVWATPPPRGWRVARHTEG